MLTRRLHTLARVPLASLCLALVATACDLNPQPLPPGETPGADAGSLGGSGGQTGADSGTVAVPTVDGGSTPPVSSDDAGLPADGSVGDAASDSAVDAAADAGTDGGDAGEALDASEGGG